MLLGLALAGMGGRLESRARTEYSIALLEFPVEICR